MNLVIHLQALHLNDYSCPPLPILRKKKKKKKKKVRTLAIPLCRLNFPHLNDYNHYIMFNECSK